MVFRYGRFVSIYRRFCKPSNAEYAAYLKARNVLHHMGNDCLINLNAQFTDPKYVQLGNNVVLSDCHLIGHDGVIAMLNKAYKSKLDAVGKIVVGDNVFIGHHAVVLRNVTIGNNVVIAAGAVVVTDIPDGCVYGGVPAKKIGNTVSLFNKLKEETDTLPWLDLINARSGDYDPEIEPLLLKKRTQYFFDSGKNSSKN